MLNTFIYQIFYTFIDKYASSFYFIIYLTFIFRLLFIKLAKENEIWIVGGQWSTWVGNIEQNISFTILSNHVFFISFKELLFLFLTTNQEGELHPIEPNQFHTVFPFQAKTSVSDIVHQQKQRHNLKVELVAISEKTVHELKQPALHSNHLPNSCSLQQSKQTVSYTHLTLPTIYSV